MGRTSSKAKNFAIKQKKLAKKIGNGKKGKALVKKAQLKQVRSGVKVSKRTLIERRQETKLRDLKRRALRRYKESAELKV